MKRFFALLLAVFLLSAPVLAEYDIFNYSGPVDNYTGVPQLSDENGSSYENETDFDASVPEYISNNMYYDYSKEMYCYPLSGMDAYLYSSAADGMIVTDGVVIETPVGVDFELYRDGTLVEDDISYVSTPGSYSLNQVTTGSQTRLMAFVISNSVTGGLANYPMPSGFVVDTVYLNNEDITNDTSLVDLYYEGSYKIYYHCMRNNEAYALYLDIDRTPPTLKLAAVENGVAAGPVDLSDRELTDSLLITLDGVSIEPTDELTQSGYYYVCIFDEAGNFTEYTFRIRIYFNMNSIVFLILLLAVFLAVFIYMRRARRKMRVR